MQIGGRSMIFMQRKRGAGHLNLCMRIREVYGSEWVRGGKDSKNVLHKMSGEF